LTLQDPRLARVAKFCLRVKIVKAIFDYASLVRDLEPALHLV
jgi:hypothetical protein